MRKLVASRSVSAAVKTGRLKPDRLESPKSPPDRTRVYSKMHVRRPGFPSDHQVLIHVLKGRAAAFLSGGGLGLFSDVWDHSDDRRTTTPPHPELGLRPETLRTYFFRLTAMSARRRPA